MEKIQRTFNKSTIALGLDVNAAISVVVALDTTTSELLFEGRVRRGHITHWGPAHLRKLLVEAAWIWIQKDSQASQRYLSIRSGKESIYGKNT